MSKNLTDKRTSPNGWTYEPLIFDDVTIERDKQVKKWGLQTHSIPEWLMILGEEYGEACKVGNEIYFRDNSLDILRKELIQTIAVAVAIIEGIDSSY